MRQKHKANRAYRPRVRETHACGNCATYLLERGHRPLRQYTDTDGDTMFVFEWTERLYNDRTQFLDDLFKD
jgi:hypothetical protein